MGRLSELRDMIREGRLGFKMNEVMSGQHEFAPGFGPEGSYPFEFRGVWGPSSVRKWINPASDEFLVNDFEGTVTVGGFCEDVPCKGRLELKYFSGRKISYIFDFTFNGTDYHYLGEKVNIRLWNLPVSHTTCFGVLTEKESGRLVSRSVTHFRLLSAPGFIASMRFA